MKKKYVPFGPRDVKSLGPFFLLMVVMWQFSASFENAGVRLGGRRGL
jgi:hypothetical protein